MEASAAAGGAAGAAHRPRKSERRRQSIGNLSEEVRIKVSRVLEQFKDSNEQGIKTKNIYIYIFNILKQFFLL